MNFEQKWNLASELERLTRENADLTRRLEEIRTAYEELARHHRQHGGNFAVSAPCGILDEKSYGILAKPKEAP